MLRKRLLPLLLLAGWPALGLGGGRIAVLEFRSARKDLDSYFVASLGERARQGALAATRGLPYEVMTRENMIMLVKQSGGSCTEGECEVETGRNIGAALVVSGDVGVISGSYVVDVRVHETRAGRLLGSASVVGKQDLEVLQLVAAKAQALVEEAIGRPRRGSGGSATSGAAAVSEGKFGDEAPQASFAPDAEEVVVSFESEPVGASVRLNGQLLCSAAPCRKKVLAGSHEATFEKERYAPAVQPFMAAKGAMVKGTLAPRFGWVSVETDPSGVTVTIDGADAGKSPVAWRETDEGAVEVVITDPCYLKAGERLAIKAGERRTSKLTATPRVAGLKVDAEDAQGNALESEVRVDGRVVGPTGKTLTVPLCSKAAAVTLEKATWEQDLKLEEGKVARLTAKPGSVRNPDEARRAYWQCAARQGVLANTYCKDEMYALQAACAADGRYKAWEICKGTRP